MFLTLLVMFGLLFASFTSTTSMLAFEKSKLFYENKWCPL